MTSKNLASAYCSAAFAVLFWASLASLSTFVPHIPVFKLSGVSLLIGGSISLFKIREWKFNSKNIFLGIYGIAGFHIFYFLGLRNAPALQTNLINYLWPLLLVILAPLFVKANIRLPQILGATIGFIGAIVAITSNGIDSGSMAQWGYLFSFFSAVIWATFSLVISKNNYSVWQNGIYCFTSGILCLGISFFLEPVAVISFYDWIVILIIGLGPMGSSFYLWNYAIRKLGAVKIAPISYFTPVLSTLFLLAALRQTPGLLLLLAVALVIIGVMVSNIRQSK